MGGGGREKVFAVSKKCLCAVRADEKTLISLLLKDLCGILCPFGVCLICNKTRRMCARVCTSCVGRASRRAHVLGPTPHVCMCTVHFLIINF